jgi:hypothetical protein
MDLKGIDHDAEGCAVWDNYDPSSRSFVPSNASASLPHIKSDNDKYTFSIPTSSARYHFVSSGPIDKSTFQVVPVKSDEAQLVVEVEVVKDLEDEARVCALPSRGNSDVYGVGFYVGSLLLLFSLFTLLNNHGVDLVAEEQAPVSAFVMARIQRQGLSPHHGQATAPQRIRDAPRTIRTHLSRSVGPCRLREVRFGRCQRSHVVRGGSLFAAV